MDAILGKPGEPVKCVRPVGYQPSIHWWLSNAKPGDKCLCGLRTKPEPNGEGQSPGVRP